MSPYECGFMTSASAQDQICPAYPEVNSKAIKQKRDFRWLFIF